MAQLYRVDDDTMNDPVEIIDASFAEVRACIFLDTDEKGDLWSFELQKRETGPTAGMRYHDAWKVVSLPTTAPTYGVGIRDMSEAMTRAALAVSALVLQELTEG